MNVLANDGISKEGVDRLNSAGFKTIVESIDQSEIIDFINNNNIIPSNRWFFLCIYFCSKNKL